jgi:hypothetical protein
VQHPNRSLLGQASAHTATILRCRILAKQDWWEEARRLLEESAAMHRSDAMEALGLLHRERGEPAAAERWYRTARTDGAHRDLGMMLLERDRPGEAEQWLQKAAEGGDVRAMNQLGKLLERQRRWGRAEGWFRWAAENGDVAGQRNLGTVLLRQGKPTDAEPWLSRAADAGDATAMANLGYLLLERGDLAEAQRWLQDSAAASDVDGMVNLGLLFALQGADVEAEHWYLRAVDVGRAAAPGSVRGLREQAWRKDVNGKWHDGTTPSHVTAMGNLGVLYEKRGDPVESERWWRRAADLGNAQAMFEVGRAEWRRDRHSAVHWFKRAADAGHHPAKREIERLFPATYWG